MNKLDEWADWIIDWTLFECALTMQALIACLIAHRFQFIIHHPIQLVTFQLKLFHSHLIWFRVSPKSSMFAFCAHSVIRVGLWPIVTIAQWWIYENASAWNMDYTAICVNHEIEDTPRTQRIYYNHPLTDTHQSFQLSDHLRWYDTLPAFDP